MGARVAVSACVLEAAVLAPVDEPDNAVITQLASSAAADACRIVRIFMWFLPQEELVVKMSVAWHFRRSDIVMSQVPICAVGSVLGGSDIVRICQWVRCHGAPLLRRCRRCGHGNQLRSRLVPLPGR